MIKSIPYFLKIGKFNLFSNVRFSEHLILGPVFVIFMKIWYNWTNEILGGCWWKRFDVWQQSSPFKNKILAWLYGFGRIFYWFYLSQVGSYLGGLFLGSSVMVMPLDVWCSSSCLPSILCLWIFGFISSFPCFSLGLGSERRSPRDLVFKDKGLARGSQSWLIGFVMMGSSSLGSGCNRQYSALKQVTFPGKIC